MNQKIVKIEYVNIVKVETKNISKEKYSEFYVQ